MIYINESLLNDPKNGPKIGEILQRAEIDVGLDPTKEREQILLEIKELGEDAVYQDIVTRLK